MPTSFCDSISTDNIYSCNTNSIQIANKLDLSNNYIINGNGYGVRLYGDAILSSFNSGTNQYQLWDGSSSTFFYYYYPTIESIGGWTPTYLSSGPSGSQYRLQIPIKGVYAVSFTNDVSGISNYTLYSFISKNAGANNDNINPFCLAKQIIRDNSDQTRLSNENVCIYLQLNQNDYLNFVGFSRSLNNLNPNDFLRGQIEINLIKRIF